MDVLSAKLMALLGPKGWVLPEDCQPWQRDWLDQYGEVPLGVAQPKSTAEVSDVLRLCHIEGVPVVPQGGNTGLSGGATPDISENQVVVCLSRMKKIYSVDYQNRAITLQAGCTLQELQQEAPDDQRAGSLDLLHPYCAMVNDIIYSIECSKDCPTIIQRLLIISPL